VKIKSVPQFNFGQKNDALTFVQPRKLHSERAMDEDGDIVASSKPLHWCLEHEFPDNVPLPNFDRCHSPLPLPPRSPIPSDYCDLDEFLLDVEQPCWPVRPSSYDDEEWWSVSPVTSPRKVEISEQEVLPLRSLSWLDEYFEKYMVPSAEK